MIQSLETQTPVTSSRFRWRPPIDVEALRQQKLAEHDEDVAYLVRENLSTQGADERRQRIIDAPAETIIEKLGGPYFDDTDHRWRQWRAVCIGSRFFDCDQDNYEVEHDKQAEAIETLKQFRDELPKHLVTGRNLLFYGSSGGGKDHLMSWLVRSVVMEIDHAPTIEWAVGADVKSMGDRSYLKVISDPVLSGTELRFRDQMEAFQVIDRAWRNCQPVWMSINAEDRDQLDSMLGRQIADRIIDQAVTVFFDWPSYRKPREERTPFQTARLRYPIHPLREIDPGPSRPMTAREKYHAMTGGFCR